ncbi:MAG: type II toxin-antitoxin system HicA family toxin [Nitrospirota bacterium]
MPKIPALTAEKLIRILMKHGFVLDHQTGSHRVYVNAATRKRVVVPYHKKDLPKGTLLSIIKAAGIDEEFK